MAASAARSENVTAPLGLPQFTNQASPAQIDLGRKLFMDRRLSPNNTMSCAMCHVPEQGFTVNELATAVGFAGRTVRRNAPTLLNVAFQRHLFHDGREESLENQVWSPLLAQNEMANASVDAVVDKLKQLSDYAQEFRRAFDSPPTRETIGRALAAYERTLLAAKSRFDRWRFGGDASALTVEEKTGFAVFQREACTACHTVGPQDALFSDQQFHAIGIGEPTVDAKKSVKVQLAPGVFVETDDAALASVSEATPTDEGRFEVTHDPAQRFAYKTPSLRNVALTAPYMHDGSLATLEDVVEFYDSRGVPRPGQSARGKPRSMTVTDKQAIIAFLKSLTGDNVSKLAREARAAFKDYPTTQ